MKKLLNLGCGKKYLVRADWVNADMNPVSPDVMKCNFIDGIPFESEAYDLVYNSHVLEHFSKTDGEQFIRECFRICKPGGIIRIALPDLEVMAREYLVQLGKALEGDEKAVRNYDWMLLEMYDQTVRNRGGGDMLQYLVQQDLTNEEFVFNRIGPGGRQLRERYFARQQAGSKVRSKPNYLIKCRNKMHNTILRLILGDKEYTCYQTGRFRHGGEIHQWMYDRFSLKRLLESVGFVKVQQQTAVSSYYSEWMDFKLDDPAESASLFMEAIKL